MTPNIIYTSRSPAPVIWQPRLRVKSEIFSGSLPDQHVLRPTGPVLHAGAGGAAAQQRHDLHEPAHHRTASRQQTDREEENHRDTKPQANV